MNKLIKQYSWEEGKRLINDLDRRNGIVVFDFDGVVSLGMYPKYGDIICTGRPIDQPIVPSFPGVPVYYNPVTLKYRGDHDERARAISGIHKSRTIKNLLDGQVKIQAIIDDDELQISTIFNHLKELNLDYNIQFILVTSGIEL